MPVIEVRLGEAFAKSIGVANRTSLSYEWRQIVSEAFEAPIESVACQWHPWFDSQNTEGIEILVHFSAADPVTTVARIDRVRKALAESIQRSTFLPPGTEVGIWPDPKPYTSYSSCRVGEPSPIGP
ncbi:MAG TPA: hypothetical protein VIH52_03880 [Candidatus Nanoarchaeia archaeon]|nr:hypothetical protein [uncultured archaeon]